MTFFDRGTRSEKTHLRIIAGSSEPLWAPFWVRPLVRHQSAGVRGASRCSSCAQNDGAEHHAWTQEDWLLSGGCTYSFAGMGMAASTLGGFQSAHFRPGIRQLPAAVEAHGIARLVQREGTSLVRVKASEEKFKAGTDHRVLLLKWASLMSPAAASGNPENRDQSQGCFAPIFRECDSK